MNLKDRSQPLPDAAGVVSNNMQTLCVKTKLKNGSVEQVREWFNTLKIRINEVMETLKNEGVVIESVFLDKHGDDNFLVYYMKAENISRIHEIFCNSTLSIDTYHKDCWKKYCEGREVLEELFDIDRIATVKDD